MLHTYQGLSEQYHIPLTVIVQAIQTGALTHQGFLIDDREPKNAEALAALRANPVGASSAPAPENSRSPKEPGAGVGARAQFRPSKKPRATPVIERGKSIPK